MKCSNGYHWGGCCDHLSIGMEFVVVAAKRGDDHDEIELIPRGTPLGTSSGILVAKVSKGRYEFSIPLPKQEPAE